MGLLDRLNLLIRSNLNVITGEDDASTSRDAASPNRRDILHEVHATLQDARRQTAQLMRDERRLEREQDTLRADIDCWEARALTALQADDEAAARDALLVKHRVQQRLRVSEEELAAVRAYLSDLLRSMERLESKRDTLRQAPRHLPSPNPPQPPYTYPARSHTPAPAHLPPIDALDDAARRWESITRYSAAPPPAFSDADASLAAFERVASQIDAYEARAEAAASFDPAFGGPLNPALDPDDPLYDARLADLEARFRHLEAESKRKPTP
jgi:phage shock protein A